ncbi:hypothetical protein [Saccharothrix deserti]|uniref:hypothetical protein n=1 Tax=Saccharothrix deserti TaxID=2593674 RepID=UPI001EE46029|nr:hypothetical protein [Saccharothrix deserti]
MRSTTTRFGLPAVLLPAVLVVAACGAPTGGPAAPTYSSVPDKPSAPVELNVLDVAGNLRSTQGMIDELPARVKANPGKFQYAVPANSGPAARS